MSNQALELISIALILCTCHAQYVMYEPGRAINETTEIGIAGGVFGLEAQYSSFCNSENQNPCYPSFTEDATLCEHNPSEVSLTAGIKPDTLRLDENLFVEIDCGVKDAHPNASIVYTLNGTLPDIYGPREEELPVTITANAGEYLFVVARCIEPGYKPGRISYWRRTDRKDYSCRNESGTDWQYDTHYKQLNLPECEWWVVGKENCDGQSFVGDIQEPSPASEPSETNTTPNPGTTPIPASPQSTPDDQPESTPGSRENKGNPVENQIFRWPTLILLAAFC